MPADPVPGRRSINSCDTPPTDAPFDDSHARHVTFNRPTLTDARFSTRFKRPRIISIESFAARTKVGKAGETLPGAPHYATHFKVVDLARHDFLRPRRRSIFVAHRFGTGEHKESAAGATPVMTRGARRGRRLFYELIAGSRAARSRSIPAAMRKRTGAKSAPAGSPFLITGARRTLAPRD